MRQAIVTKFIAPSNTRGARIRVTSDAGTLVTPWLHELNSTENHQQAAMKLAAKLGWRGTWQGGALPGNAGYAFVMVENHWENDQGELEKGGCFGWFCVA